MSRKCAGIAALMVIMLIPSAAHAEWLFTPNIGTTFGFDTFGDRDLIYGLSIGTSDEELFGWEADLSYAPDFFTGSTDAFAFDGSGSVMTAMINALIGAPLETSSGFGFRPYVTGGLGLMRMHVVQGAALFESTTREVGWNFGAGMFAFLGPHMGLRGDFRYIRSFQNQDPSWTQGLDIDIAPGNFDYWRGTVGLTLRFDR